MPRRLPLVLALAVAAAAIAAPQALAAPRPAAPLLPESLTTEHFHVHYTGDSDLADYATRAEVGDFAAALEWAYETYTTTWGYAANHADALGPDALTDVYVRDLPTVHGVDLASLAWPDDDVAVNSSGWIEVDPGYLRDPHAAAHAAFGIVQLGYDAQAPRWLKVSTADWAAFHLQGYPANDWAVVHEPDDSLDCQMASAVLKHKPCAETHFESHGYTRWDFWEYVNQRFGRDAIRDVWVEMEADGAGGGDGDDALGAVLASRGTNLGDFFNDYAHTVLTGGLAAPNVRNRLPAVHGTVETPTLTSSLVPLRVSVNRLGARYLQFTPPAQPATAPCHPATLALTVTLPAGVTSKPHFRWTATGTTTALSVSGTTATATVAWDTCSADAPAFLSLPNGSRTLDARNFFVTATVTVDTSRVVSGKRPPAGVTVLGPVIAAPTEDPAPTLDLYAPDVLKLASTARLLRLVVYSSGPGRLQASLGGASLGTVRLRAGMNRIRLRLPRPAARMVASRRPLLELTSLAPGADGWGTRFTQRVAFQKPAKSKPAKRAAARAKP